MTITHIHIKTVLYECAESIVRTRRIAAIENYLTVEEMPSGKGIADVVYLPTSLSRYPVMIVELKWNKKNGHHTCVIEKG